MLATEHSKLGQKLQVHMPAIRESIKAYLENLPLQERRQIEQVLNSVKRRLQGQLGNLSSGKQTIIRIHKQLDKHYQFSHCREGFFSEQWRRWRESEERK